MIGRRKITDIETPEEALQNMCPQVKVPGWQQKNKAIEPRFDMMYCHQLPQIWDCDPYCPQGKGGSFSFLLRLWCRKCLRTKKFPDLDSRLLGQYE